MQKGILIVILIAIVIIGGALVSPLFYQTEVNEPLPVALDKIEPGLTLEKFMEMEDEKRKGITEKIPQDVRDMIMQESALISTTVSDGMDDMTDFTSANPMLPEIIKTGEFHGLAGHSAKGLAKLIQINDSTYLRFENFEVTNGPDLRVYLTLGGDVHDGIHLEKLKGSKGDQNYLLENLDFKEYDTVVIYCQPFGAYFGQAILN